MSNSPSYDYSSAPSFVWGGKTMNPQTKFVPGKDPVTKICEKLDDCKNGITQTIGTHSNAIVEAIEAKGDSIVEAIQNNGVTIGDGEGQEANNSEGIDVNAVLEDIWDGND